MTKSEIMRQMRSGTSEQLANKNIHLSCPGRSGVIGQLSGRILINFGYLSSDLEC